MPIDPANPDETVTIDGMGDGAWIPGSWSQLTGEATNDPDTLLGGMCQDTSDCPDAKRTAKRMAKRNPVIYYYYTIPISVVGNTQGASTLATMFA